MGDAELVRALERRYGLGLDSLRRVAEDDRFAGFQATEPWLARLDLPLEAAPEDAPAT